MAIDKVTDWLSQYEFGAASEEILHRAVHEALTVGGFESRPEFVLSPRDRIDFYLPASRIGIECKIDGSATEIMRQLLRYAESPQIGALILVTSRNKHRVPPVLGSKPVRVVLTRAF